MENKEIPTPGGYINEGTLLRRASEGSRQGQHVVALGAGRFGATLGSTALASLFLDRSWAVPRACSQACRQKNRFPDSKCGDLSSDRSNWGGLRQRVRRRGIPTRKMRTHHIATASLSKELAWNLRTLLPYQHSPSGDRFDGWLPAR
jgi:hypothetical protein